MADIETKYGKIHFSHSNVITRIVNKAVESCEGRVILQNYKGGLNAGSIDIVECEEGYQLKVYVVIRFGAGIKKCTSEIINSIYENTEKILGEKPQHVTVVVTGILSRNIARRHNEVRL